MIYFDNNATTPLEPSAFEAMVPFLRDQFANPSSSSRDAREAARAIASARAQVATLLGCEPEEIVFTSGGTESNNSAIFSATQIFPERRHIITCATEHDAVLSYLQWLEEARGYEITRLGVDAQGNFDLAELARTIRPNATALVSLMWANNETGVISPIARAASLVAEQGVLFHTDAVQAAGKLPLQLGATAVHYAAISGHKIHGPKGIGALYVNRRVAFRPMLRGGGQEQERRSGTENVAGIVALGQAARVAFAALDKPDVTALRDHFESELCRRIPQVMITGSEAARMGNTSHVRFVGARAEGLMILLDQKGIAVSAGSACHTGDLHPSPVLAAMGRSPEEAGECLRISFSRLNTMDEVTRLLDVLESAVVKMRQLFGGAPA